MKLNLGSSVMVSDGYAGSTFGKNPEKMNIRRYKKERLPLRREVVGL